ncbi:RNA polymerase sigma factor [compost metagenome]
MLYFEHKTTDEIANQLNISVKTVRNHKARAVKQLRYTFVEKGLSDAMMLAVILFLNGK